MKLLGWREIGARSVVGSAQAVNAGDYGPRLSNPL